MINKTSVIIIALLYMTGIQAEPAKLVNCSDSTFQLNNSVTSMMGWSNYPFKHIKDSAGKSENERNCAKVIELRGSSYCKEPGNTKIQVALSDALELCVRLAQGATPTLEKPNQKAEKTSVATQINQATDSSKTIQENKKPKAKAVLDCAKFQHEATYPKLLTWVNMSMYEIDQTTEHNLDSKCDQIIGWAGAAHCKQPGQVEPRKIMKDIGDKCRSRFKVFQAQKAAAKLAQQKEAEAIKKNRRISAFPQSTYKGIDGVSLKQQIRQAMLANRSVAKSNAEMLKVQAMGGWQYGNFLDTKVPYRKLTGSILWHDDDNDGICAYASYNYIQTGSASGQYSPLKFKAFCMGCPEGWAKCN